ncbi:hypothetical protein H9P43_007869 [Blastocladiella emersonii ATCC 22665]|nr:hypothetical protein H9P43_007869 [Blastocladiella emersonii ATCC 22665]
MSSTPTKPAPVATFANQDKLPRLPIPSLEATLAKYRRTLEPLYGAAELARTDAAIKQALESGQLAELQRRLEAYDRTQPNSWLESWWYNLAYLSWRVPLMINSNWWMFVRDDHLPYVGAIKRVAKGTFTDVQVRRAAGLVSNLVNYKELIDAEKIPAESTKAGPLCMDQYRHMFGVTRVPKEGMDVLVREFPARARHIVVLARDQCYRVDVYTRDGSRRLALADLERQLHAVIADVTSADFTPDFPVPVLTAEHRDTWARAYARLGELDAANRASLAAIESALFTVSLDDYAPSADLDEGHRVIAHGLNGHNRWFDKALNVIVTANGRGGCNGEHSPQDALTPAVMFEHVVQHEPAVDAPGCAPAGTADVAPAQRLRFHTHGDAAMAKFLADAEVNNRKAIADSDIGIAVFDGYGSDFMKKHAKVSPDAYMQLAMQLAHFRLHGHLVPTYETASTRAFKHGRTETSRTLLTECKAWVEAMARPGVGAADRLALLRAAAAAHGKYISEASRGMGVDRHLLGLRLVMQPGEKCPVFEDPAYADSCTWRMSTSGLSNNSYKVLHGTGFGCVAPNGYGCNYYAGPNVIHFGIESKRSCPETSTDMFRIHLLGALNEVKEMVVQGNAAAGTAGKSKL